jgi:hypothetical protein
MGHSDKLARRKPITIDVPRLTQPELDALFSAGTAFTSEIADAINLFA